MTAAEMLHEEEALGRAVDSRLLVRLWPYVAPYKWQMVLTILMVFPLFFLELAPAWIVGTGLDRVIAPTEDSSLAAWETPFTGLLHAPPGIPPLVWLAGLYLLVSVVWAALLYLHTLVMVWTGEAAMRDLRSAVFDRVQRLHMGFFDRYPVGRLVTRATSDVEHVAEMFAAGIVALITDLIKMLGFAAALFLINAKLALATFCVVPFLAVAG